MLIPLHTRGGANQYKALAISNHPCWFSFFLFCFSVYNNTGVDENQHGWLEIARALHLLLPPSRNGKNWLIRFKRERSIGHNPTEATTVYRSICRTIMLYISLYIFDVDTTPYSRDGKNWLIRLKRERSIGHNPTEATAGISWGLTKRSQSQLGRLLVIPVV